MNDLYFSSHMKLINLTPFKVSLCSLISTCLKNQNSYDKNSILNMLNIIKQIMSEYKCEISKKILYEKLKEVLSKPENFILSNTDREMNGIYNCIISSLEIGYSQLKSLNDLYNLFNIDIKELKTRNEEGGSLLENGGFIDHFIRKCLFAFYKMSFEDIFKLYENFNSYIKGDELIIQLTNKESELLFEKQMKEFDRKGVNEINEKVLECFNYKHKYFYYTKIEEDSEKALNNIHKFFDYNMKYFYTDGYSTDTKIHYSLLNIIDFYFSNGYYEHAIQILFECIKLNQSNCDHEGLLKCFIWMQKIYKVLGKFDMAAKSLSTCLIKSFENNFNFLYLISSTELAFLNFYFNSNIGELESDYTQINTNQQVKSSNFSFEEKILSYSNSYNHTYTNILQLLSCNKTDYVYEKAPQYYFKNVYIILILNLLRKGHSSLAISFLKKLIDYLFQKPDGIEKDFSANNPNSTLETLKIVLNLLFEVMEYDLDDSIEQIWKIFLSNENIKHEKLVELIRLKFLSLSGRLNLSFDNINRNNEAYNYVYHCYFYFQSFISNINSNKSKEKLIEIETELINFRNYCKVNKFLKYKLQTDIFISKILINQGKITEALFNVNKIIDKSNDQQTLIKAKLILAEIYAKMKDKDKLLLIINELEPSIEKFSNVIDKFQFYFFQTQFTISEFLKDTNQKNIENNLKVQLTKCVKSSLITNNAEFIKSSLFLLNFVNRNSNAISAINVHSNNLNKLFKIFYKFSLTHLEQLELIRCIQNNNRKLFNSIIIC